MRKIIFILLMGSLFSCHKEKDITGQDFVVTATSSLWSTSKMKFVNLDSTKFQFFYKTSSNLPADTPFATLYTGPDGTCKITLKGDTEYYIYATSATYKDASGEIHCYTNPLKDEPMSSFNSTHEKNDKRHTYIPGDFTIDFVDIQEQPNQRGATKLLYPDPFN